MESARLRRRTLTNPKPSLIPGAPAFIGHQRRRSSPNLSALDRFGMLIMEANEIASCLNKKYVFTKEKEIPGDENLSLVKIKNIEWNISSIWTFAKLKERLIPMRKLVYSSSIGPIEVEAVFFDQTDVWIKESDGKPISDYDTLIEIPTKDTHMEVSKSNKLSQSQTDLRTLGRTNVSSFTRRSLRGQGQQPRPRSCTVSGDVTRAHILAGQSFNSPQPVKNFGSKRSNKNERQSPQTIIYSKDNVSIRSTDSNDSTHSNSPKARLKADYKYHDDEYSEGDALDYVPQKDTSPQMLTSFHLPNDSHNMMGEKYIIKDSHSNISSSNKSYCKSDNYTQTDEKLRTRGNSDLNICLNMIRQCLQAGAPSANLVDKILTHFESIKVVVMNLFEGFTQEQDNGHGIEAFSNSTLMKYSSTQIVSALHLLSTNSSQWVATSDGTDPAVEKICNQFIDTRHRLSIELVTFLQACDCEEETAVQEFAGKIVDTLYDLCRWSGELSLALDYSPDVTLTSQNDLSDIINNRSSKDNDILNSKVSADLKQAFLNGCDTYVLSAIDNNISSVEESERQLRNLIQQCLISPNPNEDIIKASSRIVSKTKILLKLFKTIQNELNVVMREDSGKPEHYFQFYYLRTRRLMNRIEGLTNQLKLLVQADSPLINDPENSSLKKVKRCTELMDKSVERVILSSNMEGDIGDGTSSSGASPLMDSGISDVSSILTDVHSTKIEQSGNDVKSSIKTVSTIIEDRLIDDPGQERMSRRMLPATPGGRGLIRSHSASSKDRVKYNIFKHHGRSQEA